MGTAGTRTDAATSTAIVEAYTANDLPRVIASRFGVHISTVYDVVRRSGVRVRSVSESKRVFSCDHHYFDSIDTEEKAYWLGFITADGCVTVPVNGSPRIQVQLAARDIEHIRKFAGAIRSNHPIADVRSNGHPAAKLSIRSRGLATGLARQGVVPRKSLTAMPANVSESLIRHYWRGVFDGDGCICERADGGWSASLVASEPMADAFARFAFWAAGSRPTIRAQREGGVFYFSTSGICVVQALLRALYEGSVVFLDRKHALYQRVLLAKSKGRPKVRGVYTVAS